jgi:putative oxidoreductase
MSTLPKRLRRVVDAAEPYVYALTRIFIGLLLAFHGAQKIFGWYSDHPSPVLASQIGIGGLLEFVLGLGVAVGVGTRGAAFLASGMMAVAYTQFHWKLASSNGQWIPTVNHGELAFVYAWTFLLFALRGAGRLSVDSMLDREGR